ncbi:DNA repair protein RAD51 homolog 4-like [Alnus glutinosa]|uniref:DNA repair protein RAD51 homolog 4-like n=1 Tax=Alnus glutinosa TaxID=3517 RepID=UPI002D783BC8|nr:DNA repair protein RAD51 homolog 4-like [Alnus glutinosa]
MAPLKALEQEYPIIDSNFQSFCASQGIFSGGLREGQLTELVGPSSSGKTQLCLLAAFNVAKEHMCSVVYLDTGNSFSPQRVKHFICRRSDPAIEQEDIYLFPSVY